MPDTLSKPDRRVSPELKPTRHDQVTSGMICAVVVLTLLIAAMLLAEIPEQKEPAQQIPFVMVELPTDEETGETTSPELESPSGEVVEAAIAEVPRNSIDLSELLETVIELSDVASANVEAALDGKAVPVRDRKPRIGGDGQSGIPRDQRWFVKFSESSLEEYARQLDFFRIELGALFPDGRLVLIREVSGDPTMRTLRTGKGQDRLYMRWRGGQRLESDRDLFAKAGVDASSATILHFYDAELEKLLVKVEVGYRQFEERNIRRTYFNVRKDGDGYSFQVSSQSYLR
jgi:hypothetical protein